MDNKKRQKRNNLILFEHFPDHLFDQIFSYLNGVDALFAFFQLNYRCQCLVGKYCRMFDFKSIRKIKFDFIFQHCDTKQWKSLRLSDDDETSGQIEQFYSHRKVFPQLESLSIVGMKINKTPTLLFHLPFLTNLVSLTMKSVCGRTISTFDLPQLKNLVGSSCRNVSWLKNFSRLENLEYTFIYCCSSRSVLTWPLTLKRLRIVFEGSEHPKLIYQSLRDLVQLETLKIHQKEKGRILPNGQLWEQIIRSSLSLLKKFKFYFRLYENSVIFNQVEQVVSSFSTPFYTHEKKWFVRCDISTKHGTVCFYSSSFSQIQTDIFTNNFNKSVSTSSNRNNYNEKIYRNMKKFIFRETIIKHDEILNLIIDRDFYSMNLSNFLNQLRHLEIKYDTTMSSKDFNLLLDSTPNLDSLTAENSVLQILTQNWTHIIICNQLSQKIRSLKLYSAYNIPWKLNRYELHQMLSSFARKCEHLSLYVRLSSETIAFILQLLRQLLSLHVIIKEEDCLQMNINGLEQHKTKFNRSYKVLSHGKYEYYFWLEKQP